MLQPPADAASLRPHLPGLDGGGGSDGITVGQGPSAGARQRRGPEEAFPEGRAPSKPLALELRSESGVLPGKAPGLFLAGARNAPPALARLQRS